MKCNKFKRITAPQCLWFFSVHAKKREREKWHELENLCLVIEIYELRLLINIRSCPGIFAYDYEHMKSLFRIEFDFENSHDSSEKSSEHSPNAKQAEKDVQLPTLFHDNDNLSAF